MLCQWKIYNIYFDVLVKCLLSLGKFTNIREMGLLGHAINIY